MKYKGFDSDSFEIVKAKTGRSCQDCFFYRPEVEKIIDCEAPEDRPFFDDIFGNLDCGCFKMVARLKD